MISDITRRTILQIKENIDSYHKIVADVDVSVAEIKEKYRKLAEEETKALLSNVDEYKKEEKFWTKTLSRYDADVVKEVLGESSDATAEVKKQNFESDSTAEQTPPSDELFVVDPEAEEEERSKPDDVSEPECPVPVEEEIPDTQETKEVSEEEWPATPEENAPTEDVVEEETPAADVINGEEWPEEPMEWN
jgi:hypothetical protein